MEASFLQQRPMHDLQRISKHVEENFLPTQPQHMHETQARHDEAHWGVPTTRVCGQATTSYNIGLHCFRRAEPALCTAAATGSATRDINKPEESSEGVHGRRSESETLPTTTGNEWCGN